MKMVIDPRATFLSLPSHGPEEGLMFQQPVLSKLLHLHRYIPPPQAEHRADSILQRSSCRSDRFRAKNSSEEPLMPFRPKVLLLCVFGVFSSRVERSLYISTTFIKCLTQSAMEIKTLNSTKEKNHRLLY